MDKREQKRVRFAPSPTGYLHIGSARTALFNWLFAKKYGAEFMLRIEDTDIKRSKKEFLDEILDSLQWLGMRWDSIVYQSQRLTLYREYAQKLIDMGKAHTDQGAVVFQYDFESVAFRDLIRKEIEFNELAKETEVIIKSDGTPTYNFACCIDDALFGITHVIRGDDHISNTPKQILIYRALGLPQPLFAHLPMILADDGSKLSKRFGATSIREYKAKGYLSQALTNYLLLLGWSPKDNRELISLDEVISLFDVKDINKTAACFSLDKLTWINSEYIKKSSLDDLTKYAKAYLKEKDFLPKEMSDEALSAILTLFKERLPRLSDIIERAYFCFYDDFQYSTEAKEILERDLSGEVRDLLKRLEALGKFDAQSVEEEFRAAVKTMGFKTRDLVHPVRVALTGNKVGPGLFETMAVLGKDKVVARLERLAAYWEEQKT